MELKQTLQIAVRALVEHALRSGDLEHSFLGASRAVEGTRAHQAIQQTRPGVYTSEITVSHEIETERLKLIVSGRIDGVYRYPDRTVIDEIKTTRNDLDRLTDQEKPQHWGQAKCYAYLYAVSQDLEAVDVQMTYYRPDTGDIREVVKSFTRNELELFFQDLIGRYLYWAETIIAWYDIRNDSLRTVAFPFPEYRPGQREMAVDVYRTIRQGGQILIQAPTGIGKTMAVVFPGLKTISEGVCSKLFYLTARTTGKQIAEKALDELRRNGGRIKSLTLTAKEKICFHSEAACSAEECEFAKGHFDRINGALEAIFTKDSFDRSCIVETSQRHQVCPFELSLELALWADCIICDYNYAFDPRVFLRRFFMEETNGYVFLIDEAHNLVDRAREMFSAELWKQPFLDIRRALKNALPSLYRCMGKINAFFLEQRRLCEASGDVLAEEEPPESLLPLLRQFLRLAEKWLVRNIDATFRKDLLDLYFKVSGFIKISEKYDTHYATCKEKVGNDLKIKLFCVDPSSPLEEALTRCTSAIFFSATLSPMCYFKKSFGSRDTARERIYSSPFPSENLGVLVLDRVSTRYRHRQATASTVATSLGCFAVAKVGNYLFFFPSYQYLTSVYSVFSACYPDIHTLVQTPEMGEDDRDRFLAHFLEETHRTTAGFVVMGGVFGEGIDLVGERLSGAAVVGVGLPGLSLDRELIRDYFEYRFHAGFEFAYLYPGMIRVLQAAGRVIRSENDRGMVLLIGQRFTAHPYRELLPEEWVPARIRNESDIKQVLKRFWKS